MPSSGVAMPPPSLLTELPASPGTPPLQRRWFTSDALDLIVWLSPDGDLQAFQLCHGKPLAEHALEWRAGQGFRHLQVDDGSLGDMGHKRTPVMQANGAVDAGGLLRQLELAGAALPLSLREAVRDRLRELAGASHD